MKNSKKSPPNNQSSYSDYLTLSFKMALIILAGVYGGVKLDDLLDLKFPAFTLSLSMLSLALAIYVLIRDVLKK